ncbi:hypothetical protein AgCh_012261 [Apium graveolens]
MSLKHQLIKPSTDESFNGCSLPQQLIVTIHKLTEAHGLTETIGMWCFVNGQPKAWAVWLHWAEYWYNTSYHVSTKCSPFQALYGREPPHLIRFERGSTAVASLKEQLLERDAILDDLKAQLVKAQQRMKAQEDSKRRELEF